MRGGKNAEAGISMPPLAGLRIGECEGADPTAHAVGYRMPPLTRLGTIAVCVGRISIRRPQVSSSRLALPPSPLAERVAPGMGNASWRRGGGWRGQKTEDRPSGYILLETLVAMVVLSLGVLAVNRALQDALVARAQARDYTEARFMLERVMGEIDLRPELVVGTESGTFGAAHPRFSWGRKVSLVDIPVPRLPGTVPEQARQTFVPPVSRLVKISVTVRWTRAGRSFEEKAETLVSETRLRAPETDA